MFLTSVLTVFVRLRNRYCTYITPHKFPNLHISKPVQSIRNPLSDFQLQIWFRPCIICQNSLIQFTKAYCQSNQNPPTIPKTYISQNPVQSIRKPLSDFQLNLISKLVQTIRTPFFDLQSLLSILHNNQIRIPLQFPNLHIPNPTQSIRNPISDFQLKTWFWSCIICQKYPFQFTIIIVNPAQ
jgi:hypothetical protein